MIDAKTATDLLHVAGTRGRNSATKAEISATSTATTTQQESLKSLSYQAIAAQQGAQRRRNEGRNTHATKGRKKRRFVAWF